MSVVQGAYEDLITRGVIEEADIKNCKKYFKWMKTKFEKKKGQLILQGKMAPTKVVICELVDTDEEDLTESIPWRMPRRLFEKERKQYLNPVPRSRPKVVPQERIPANAGSTNHPANQPFFSPTVPASIMPLVAVPSAFPLYPMPIQHLPMMNAAAIFAGQPLTQQPRFFQQQPFFRPNVASASNYLHQQPNNQQQISPLPNQPRFNSLSSSTAQQRPTQEMQRNSRFSHGVKPSSSNIQGKRVQYNHHNSSNDHSRENGHKSNRPSSSTNRDHYRPNAYKRTSDRSHTEDSTSKHRKINEPSSSSSRLENSKPSTSRQPLNGSQALHSSSVNQRLNETSVNPPGSRTSKPDTSSSSKPKNSNLSEKLPAQQNKSLPSETNVNVINGKSSSTEQTVQQPHRVAPTSVEYSFVQSSGNSPAIKLNIAPSKMKKRVNYAEPPSSEATAKTTSGPDESTQDLLPESFADSEGNNQPDSTSMQPSLDLEQVVQPLPVDTVSSSDETTIEVTTAIPNNSTLEASSEALIPLQLIKQESALSLTTAEIDPDETLDVTKIKDEDAETASNPDLAEDNASDGTENLEDFDECSGANDDTATPVSITCVKVEADIEKEREEDLKEVKYSFLRCRNLQELLGKSSLLSRLKKFKTFLSRTISIISRV